MLSAPRIAHRSLAKIAMSQIKELREKTGTGVSACKAALVEAEGDLDKAYEVLRKKGLAVAAKKAGRVAAEGLIAVARSDDLRSASIVEVNTETDFVARNEGFMQFARDVAATAQRVRPGTVEELSASEMPGGGLVSAAFTEMIAKMGENITLRRTHTLEVEDGVVSVYLHNKLGDGCAMLGCMVALQAPGAPAEALDTMGSKVCMHIAAASPLYLDRASVDMNALEKEKEVLADQARGAGKKEELVEKIVTGRLNKFYQESCLLDQTFLGGGGDADEKPTSVSKALAAEAKALSVSGITPLAYLRFNRGEGIEKEKEDYAAEVASMANM